MACLTDHQLARVVGQVPLLLTLEESILGPRLEWLRRCPTPPLPSPCVPPLRPRAPHQQGPVNFKEQVDRREPVQCSQDNA